MEHQFYIDRLSAYFDNELKNEELVIVKEHVMGCSECQKKLQELEKLENLIIEKSDLSESDYWEQSAQKIESALSSQTDATIISVGKSKSSVSLWWKLTGVAASLVLVALFAFEQKDSGDELLRQEAPKTGIKHVIGYTAPIIKDTAINEDLSVGRVVEQKEEPKVVSDEIKKDTKEEVPLAVKQTVDNLQTKPQTAPKPQHVKKSDKDLLTENITAALKTVYDPEIPVNIYDLGLIYNIAIDDEGNVKIDLTLTAPGCPVAHTFPGMVEDAVRTVEGINDIELRVAKTLINRIEGATLLTPSPKLDPVFMGESSRPSSQKYDRLTLMTGCRSSLVRIGIR